MTQYEFEYALGRQAFLEHLPFKSNRSIAWQNGWLDTFNQLKKEAKKHLDELDSYMEETPLEI
jgi:hypothetical protein